MYDFAPGENHIALRYRNKSYYVPELFHHSPTFDTVVPLLISDVNRSKSVRAFYGIFDNNYKDIMLVNNYPIRKIKIFGKITGEIYRDFDPCGKTNPRNFILITLDDFSDSQHSTIKVKVFESVYLQSGLLFNTSYGRILEVCGTINEYNNTREVHADFITLIGGQKDIHVEISMWQEILEYRSKVLIKPWIYSAVQIGSAEAPVEISDDNFEKKYVPYRPKDGVKIYNDSLGDSNIHEDSLLLLNNKLKKHRSKECSNDLIDHEINSDSSIQITGIRQVPIQVTSNFQLSLEFIRWIFHNNFRCFKLVELYNDPSMNWLLNNMANLTYLTIHLQQEKKSHQLLMQEVFHSVRHNLQVNYNLIKVTKSQKVYLNNLKRIYNHVKQCLNVIKIERKSNNSIRILHIKSYLNNLLSQNPEWSKLNHKILNAIIDFILTNDWDERSDWAYDAKSIQWKYTKA